ncbi:hypothetical protein MBLNU230_g7746t1 [Neophaeotheca triangularis]
MKMSGSWSSSANGYNGHSRTSSSTFSFANGVNGTKTSNKSNAGKISIVSDSAAALKRKSASELTKAVSSSVGEMSFIKLVQWIRSERLASLPHQGSTWDTVLIRSLHVAERLHKFETSIQSFAADSSSAGELAYSHLRLLMEMGHENSRPLNKAFGLFYRCSLVINALLERSELLSASYEIQEQLCTMFTDLITLIVEVAIHFHRSVAGMESGDSSVSLDLYQVFGDTLQTYDDRRSRITDLIWSSQTDRLGGEVDEVIPIDVLRRWLMPQDRVLDLLGNDHTVFADDLAEFTGLWLQDSLLKFVKGNDECMLVNGSSGSGKTTLAATVMERLQRPIARQTFQSVFVTIGEVPAQATSLHLVKSILHQLLQNRTGNLKLYTTLVEAHQEAQRTADPEAYENCLWSALSDALQNPLHSSNPTVLVIDGLDDINGKKPAGQKLLERLVNAVGKGQKTKLIAFSESLSLPKSSRGTQRTITPEDTRDDSHLVAIRALARCSQFVQRPGPEQDTILATILDAGKGSFTWKILFCECLKAEKTQDAFNKTLGTLKSTPPSVDDLVLKLLTTLQPSLDSCLALAWLNGAARPLTFEEISSLLSVNVEKGEMSNSSSTVERILESVRPLLSISYNVVRTRHGRIAEALQKNLQSLIDQGKIPLSHKNTQIDLLLRCMIFAKDCLPESSAPTLDPDYSLPARLFPKHPLLEYVVRYWPYHLEHTPFNPASSGSPKLPEEFKKVFPASTAMPCLEYLCWAEQYPGSQEVKLHTTGYQLRTTIFTQNHPAVMQGYINTALYYGPMGNDKETSNAYYTACIIGKNVLKPSHPVTVACANHYLDHTSTMVTPSRSEIMTHREQVLQILVTAYQQQFGVHSEMVITTKQQLIQLYSYIREETNANSLKSQLEFDTGTGSQSSSEKVYPSSLGGALNTKLVSRRTEESDKPTISLFEDEEEEEEDTTLTLDTAKSMMEKAKSLTSQNQFKQAELLYVQLWRQMSSICQSTMAVEWHRAKIDTVNSYAQALKSSKRESESSAILMSVAKEYQQHELSYSQSIVSSITESADILKSVGHAAAALSIYQQSASYYSSTHKTDSKELKQIEEMISTTTVQVSKEASSRSESSSSQLSENSLEAIFQSSILNRNSKIEASTFTSVNRLVEKHMSAMQYEKAVEVIQATLQRTWMAFTADTTHGMSLASVSFQKESIALVESLYQAYTRSRKVEKAMDVYLRLYRATVPVAKEQPQLFEKHYKQLVALYDQYGYFDRAITILQEVLPIYTNTYGATNDKVIDLLFDLGDRCRNHARTHAYYLEYYQQIVKATTKDNKVVGARALEALKIVSVSYWEERRYIEARQAYGLLWATLIDTHGKVSITKDQATYLQSLYQQYYQCLEATQTDFETLYAVTEQYHNTCKAVFGANHEVTAASAQAFAQVCQQSEKSQSKAVEMLEQAYSNMSSNSRASSTESQQITQQLIQTYSRSISQSSSASTETVEKLKTMHQKQFQASYQEYGYRSETSINSMKEIASLEFRQGKTEAAMKQITSATQELNTLDVSNEHIIQSAETIASVFQASNRNEVAREFLSDLRLQLVAHEKRADSRFQFDVTKSNKASLVFLATLEYQLRKDMSLTQSDIYTDLLSERLYYNEFYKVIQERSSFEALIKAAAPLRHYLLKRDRKQQAQSVVSRVVTIANEHDLKSFSLEAKTTSPAIFITGILDYMGLRRNAAYERAVILATNKVLRGLVQNKKFAEAFDIASIGFKYAKAHEGYWNIGLLSSGFALASQLDGRGVNRCPDETLRKKMLQLSNTVVKDLLQVARKQGIDLAQVQLSELNELVAMLGEQGDWDTLESLLSSLWNTKKAQQTWPSDVLLRLGSRLIAVRYLSGQPVKAIRLCEDIAYNLRRTQGNADPATLDTYNLLVQLYTSTAQMYQKSAGNDKSSATLASDYFKKAVLLEEDILRRFASEGANGEAGDDEDEEDTAAAILAEHGVQADGVPHAANGHDKADRSANVKHHLRLLKLAHQRLGQWPKPAQVYEQLNANIYRLYGDQLKGVDGVEKWQTKGFGGGKAESGEGTFEAPKQWDIVVA